MPHKLYNILLILGIFAVLVAAPAFWYLYNPTHQLEVAFLDIGQGDAILIKSPMGQNALIDGGPDDSVIEQLSNNLSWWDRTIDLMVLTHPHDDHVAGLVDVIKRYKVKKILYTGVVCDSPNYLEWLRLIKDKKISLIIIDRPQIIKIGDECELRIIYPFNNLLNKEVSNLNNSSIIIKLVYKQNKFLFAGDIELEAEEELLNSGVDLKTDVFKANHHGSDTSNSIEFLQAVQPEIAVIQVGDNNFGHPSRRVIKRFERAGAQIFRNDLDGAVKIISDGYSFNVMSEPR